MKHAMRVWSGDGRLAARNPTHQHGPESVIGSARAIWKRRDRVGVEIGLLQAATAMTARKDAVDMHRPASTTATAAAPALRADEHARIPALKLPTTRIRWKR
jgi:hypothetical protein